MFQTLRNAWKIVDLRKKILFTLLIVLIFRIGSVITVPFVDASVVAEASRNSNDFMGIVTMVSGGGFSNASLFALSITPYINSSIIIQLLTVAIPVLERWAKEGAEGRKKLNKVTRVFTVVLGLMLGTAYYFLLRSAQYDGAIVESANSSVFATIFSAVVIILCFTAGSTLVMWLGEQINDRGIGNGISILLFAGILSRIPVAAETLWKYFWQGGVQQLETAGSAAIKYIVLVPVVLILFLAIIAFIVFMNDAERHIPIQYAKKVVGRKMYGGQNTFIPVKVNMSGVMPIILASSIISLPSIIASFINDAEKTNNWFFNAFRQDSWFYIIAYFLMIIGFAYFYVTIQYDPTEMANNLRKNSGAIPGYRPGEPTVEYLKKVINKVTFIGALFLGVIALFPSLFGKFSGIYGLTLGGTSIMIVVGVALETTQQIESQMMMRHHKGFLD